MAINRREEAVLMQPVADPAGWHPAEIAANEDWVYRFPDHEIAEIMDTVRAIEASGRPLLEIGPDAFSLPRTAASLKAIYAEIKDGRGFVQMRGLPVADMNRLQAAITFWGIGAHFGHALSQNGAGHMLGHVKDLGLDYDLPNTRAYHTKSVLRFHNDQCDMVGLMCIRKAKAGGASRVCSSIAIYNEMLKRRPDLARDLCEDLYWSRHGEVRPGQEPWYRMPAFTVRDGHLSVRGPGTHARKAQDLPGAERWSATRVEAVDLFQKLAEELAADLPFEEGDLQILNSYVTVHSRRAYDDHDDPAKKRHLLRLWMLNHDLRPVPDDVREHYSGIEVEGFVPKAPLEAA